MRGLEKRATPGDAPSGVTFAPGDVIGEKYRVEGTIGSGGMAIVVSARHVTMGHRLAIKIPRLGATTDRSEAVARFLGEARAAARIQSDHVVRVTDVAELPDGTPYMVMDHLVGEDLRELLDQRGTLSIDEALGYALQACEGLAEAHAAGVIHRDLKPSNLFLAKKSNGTTVLKVLDFGVSKVRSGAGEAQLTVTGMLIGSPIYMAPEQMRSSKHVDVRADVWSLGLILYEMLTGQAPFERRTIPEVCFAVKTVDPLPVRALRPEVPPELDAIVLQCLRKDREERYGSMGALACALAPYAAAPARVHADRANMATLVIPSEKARAEEAAATVPATPNPVDSTLQMGGILLRTRPHATSSYSGGGARPRPARRMWTAIGAAACLVTAAGAALLARGLPTETTRTSAALVPAAAPSPMAAASPIGALAPSSVTVDAVHGIARDAGARPARAPTPIATASAGWTEWKWGDRN
jgi:serine/threonine protein kinase